MDERQMKTKVEEDSSVEIRGNIMSYGRSTIQLSNVSRVEVAPLPKKEYPSWLIVATIVGLCIMFTGEFFFKIGMIVFFLGALDFAYIWYKNNNLGDYLEVSLNSGKSVYFSCDQKEFLTSAKNAIVACFEKDGRSTQINFKDCVISSSQIGGENNTNVSGGF